MKERWADKGARAFLTQNSNCVYEAEFCVLRPMPPVTVDWIRARHIPREVSLQAA
jgi:hypothetical protein